MISYLQTSKTQSSNVKLNEYFVRIALTSSKLSDRKVEQDGKLWPGGSILDSLTTIIGNGNRTEWSPIRSVIIRVINKIRGSPICLIIACEQALCLEKQNSEEREGKGWERACRQTFEAAIQPPCNYPVDHLSVRSLSVNQGCRSLAFQAIRPCWLDRFFLFKTR